MSRADHKWNSSPRNRNPTPPHLVRAVRARDEDTCQQCGAPGREVDHINHTGSHDMSNLQCLCRDCHRVKTAAEAKAGIAAAVQRRHRPQPPTLLSKWQDNHTHNKR